MAERTTDQIVESLRQKIVDHVDGVLDLAEKITNKPDKYTSKNLADDTVQLIFDSSARTVGVYKDLFQLWRGNFKK